MKRMLVIQAKEVEKAAASALRELPQPARARLKRAVDEAARALLLCAVQRIPIAFLLLRGTKRRDSGASVRQLVGQGCSIVNNPLLYCTLSPLKLGFRQACVTWRAMHSSRDPAPLGRPR